MEDADLVRKVAADFLLQYGRTVLEHLLEREAWARSIGDETSADAWLDIAQSAAEQMREASRKDEAS